MANHPTAFDQLDPSHIAGHAISAASLIGILAGALPALAALGAVVWYCIAIYETKTVQTWLARWRKPKGEPHDPSSPIA
jgi:hypothetical protein